LCARVQAAFAYIARPRHALAAPRRACAVRDPACARAPNIYHQVPASGKHRRTARGHAEGARVHSGPRAAPGYSVGKLDSTSGDAGCGAVIM